MNPNARPEGAAAHVAVFAKAPVPGQVKTRLAPLLGEEGAARLHEALLLRALTVATESRVGPVELWCAPDASHPFFLRCARDFGVTLHVQQGADLGARMATAFEHARRDGAGLVLIGSDCPALTPADLQDAAAAVANHDAVFMPAEDGGYVLVAMARPAPVFEGIEWSVSTVMARTRARLGELGLRWKELRTLWDVDRPEDHARLQGLGWSARQDA